MATIEKTKRQTSVLEAVDVNNEIVLYRSEERRVGKECA